MIASLFALTDPDSTMGIFPADHLIVGHQQFVKAISTADHIARSGDNIVTIGIKPDHPSMHMATCNMMKKVTKIIWVLIR